jgi:hypothetical protein
VAISVTWGTKVINVPQADLTPLGGDLYELDVNALRLALKDLEDDPDGMPFPDTHRHNTEIVLSGDTYARTFEIINGYTLEFEDGFYNVKCIGANHNIADVMVQNCVSIIVGNSAGLIVRESGTTGLTPEESADLELVRKTMANKQVTDPVTGKLVVYDDDDTSVYVEADIYEDAAATQPYRGQGVERRDKLQ